MKRLRRARRQSKSKKWLRKKVLVVGTAAAVTVGGANCLKKAYAHSQNNPHHLVVSPDADKDLLADREEFAIGFSWYQTDQNRNGVVDGVDLAQVCLEDIDELPIWDPHGSEPEPNKPYRTIIAAAFGLEECAICGHHVPMIKWELVNPRNGLRVQITGMVLHFLQHGSFTYDSLSAWSGHGRVEVPRLLALLERRFPEKRDEHQLGLDYSVEPFGRLAQDANDLDGDLLADSEELQAGLNLHQADQDNNLVPDGPELARQCAEAVEQLPVYDQYGSEPEPNEPYKINHWLRGLEFCAVCGQAVNMGYCTVVNPRLGLSLDVDIIALHYMEHGSFSYHGLKQLGQEAPLHLGRTQIAKLLTILEIPNRCGQLGTLYLPADVNRDCNVDFEDFAETADQWLHETDDE